MNEQVVDCFRVAFCLAFLAGSVLFFVWMDRRHRTEQLRGAIRRYSQGAKLVGCAQVQDIMTHIQLKHTYLLLYQKDLIERMQSEYKFGMEKEAV